MKQYKIIFLPSLIQISVDTDKSILEALRSSGFTPDAPCGGNGTCGKCKVLLQTSDGSKEVLACQTRVVEDLNVFYQEDTLAANILTEGITTKVSMKPIVEDARYLMAFDIGTTTLVGYLLNGDTGETLAVSSMLNPQFTYGADVVSRIQYALQEDILTLTNAVREGMDTIVLETAMKAQIKPEQISLVSVVGNPCMQQLFLGIPPKNLATPPFNPILRHSGVLDAMKYIPSLTHSQLLNLPDISGYIGADTIACILSTKLYKYENQSLMVDIGTNGEMVMGNRRRMVACSTAAGPALEGAKIQCGMRGTKGAIDHIWVEDNKVVFTTIESVEPIGICGSGLIDAVAVLLQLGFLNKRGRIQLPEDVSNDNKERLVEIDGERAFLVYHEKGRKTIYLNQQDVREVQLAKGAIAAGVQLLAGHLGIAVEEIESVLLAGAFGSFINVHSACTIGLLPAILEEKIKVVGNAAGAGAKMVVCNEEEFRRADKLVKFIEFLELASLPQFQHAFAQNLGFLTPPLSPFSGN